VKPLLRCAICWALWCVSGSAGFAQCPASLSPASASVPATENTTDGSVNRTFAVTAPSSCRWAAQSGSPWISIVFGGTPAVPASGAGTVGYSVQANLAPVSRNGTIQIGDLTLPVVQAAANCTIGLSATSADILYTGGPGVFSVNTTCQWLASSNVDWIQATGGTSGNGQVAYSVQQNPFTSDRTGTISVSGTTFTIRQKGSPCAISLGTDSANVRFIGGNGAITVRAPATCAWSVVTLDTWVSVTPQSGSGAMLAMYQVDVNPFGVERKTTLVVGGAPYVITQQAAPCSFTLTPAIASIDATGGNGSVAVGTACSYLPLPSAPWISLRSPGRMDGSGNVLYTVDENRTPNPRSGTISIGSVAFTINQAARFCAVILDATSVTYNSPNAANGQVNVAAQLPCWTAASFSPWIHVTSAAQTASGPVTFSVDPNQDALARTGEIQIGPQTLSVTQAGLGIGFTADGVASAATKLGGPIAPGEVIVVSGVGLGPDKLTLAQLNSDGTAITTSVAGTRVLFDGIPAPIVYTWASQVSAIVPYAIGSRTSTQMVVEYNSVQSAPVAMPVAATAPGVFTIDGSGIGPGSILNEDNTFNSLVPAGKGSAIRIYATGEGAMAPAAVDGVLSQPPLPSPRAPVVVYLNGIEAPLVAVTASPGNPAGILEVTATIPANAQSGNLPVQLKIGGVLSRDGVTVSVR
jgi:uncharacterized protein (TIGR03437 family)